MYIKYNALNIFKNSYNIWKSQYIIEDVNDNESLIKKIKLNIIFENLNNHYIHNNKKVIVIVIIIIDQVCIKAV